METGSTLERLRGEIFRNFASVFLNLPDLAFARTIAEGRYITGASFDNIIRILPEAELESQPELSELLTEGVADIESYVQSCQGTPLETVHLDLSVERTRLCRGIARGYGPPPPYGFAWRRPSPESLHSLDRLYSRVGFSVPNRENPTYIGVEMAFLALLCDRIAEAQDRGESVEELSGAREELIQEHVVSWVPSYLDAVIRESKLDFFKGVAKLLLASLNSFGTVTRPQVPTI